MPGALRRLRSSHAAQQRRGARFVVQSYGPSTPAPCGTNPGVLTLEMRRVMLCNVGVQITIVPLRPPFAKMMALAAPIRDPLRLRRTTARSPRARVTLKASLPGGNNPLETEGLVGKPGRLVSATLAALLLVRPSVLPGS
jgi:hypothetical protein